MDLSMCCLQASSLEKTVSRLFRSFLEHCHGQMALVDFVLITELPSLSCVLFVF